MIDVEIVAWSSHDAHCWGMCYEAFKPNFDSFALSKRLLNKIRLALQKDELTGWKYVFVVNLSQHRRILYQFIYFLLQ